MKKCSKCGSEKELSEFYENKNLRDGHTNTCITCVVARSVLWQNENKERHAEHCVRHIKKHAAASNRRSREWKRRSGYKSNSGQWAKDHPAQTNARNSRHRAEKTQATPAWTNHVAVGEFYALAAIKTKLTGSQYHVDHIVPLRSPLVCGLHTHYNLQILPGKENARKGNRAWPDMPEQGVQP